MQNLPAEQDQAQLEILEKKRKAYGNLGVLVHTTEMQLQAMAQDIINSIHIPTKPEDLPEAEALLKTIAKRETECTDLRKTITSKFADVANRLMEPEKSIPGPKKKLYDAIVQVKKDKEKADELARQKDQDKKNLREHLTNQITEFEKNVRIKMNDIVSKSYEHALGVGAITLEGLPEYLILVRAKLTIKHATISIELPSYKSLSEADYAEVESTLEVSDPSELVNEFHSALADRYIDYEIALNNKKDALALADKEEKEKKQAIIDNADDKIVAASFEAQSDLFSAPAVDQVVTKALKKSYEIDLEKMPETYENAMLLMAAYMANKELCRAKTTVSKWYAFNATSAGKALSKVKCDDNAFAPKGIIFKEVDKL